MNCRQCTRRLSEHIDGALDFRTRARIDKHLAGCSSCAAALRELDESIRLLREAGGAEAPAGLADGILLKLASAMETRASRAPARRGSGRARVAVAAAALVLASLAGLLAWQGSFLARRVAGLESTMTDMSGRWQSEKQGFVEALERSRGELRTARAALERAEASRVEELAAASRRAALLEAEVAALREERARRAAEDGSRLAAGRMEPDPIILRQRSGRIELETRGPPHAFIPRLFELARDESDPEIAGLALSSLEGILETGKPVASGAADQDAPDAHVGPAKWFQRGVGVFTSAAAGNQNDSTDDAPSEETPRERRLRALESVWRSAAGA
jgi:hypothetical protein